MAQDFLHARYGLLRRAFPCQQFPLSLSLASQGSCNSEALDSTIATLTKEGVSKDRAIDVCRVYRHCVM